MANPSRNTALLKPLFRRIRHAAGIGSTLLLAGCDAALLNPQGDIGAQEKHLILLALGVMMLVVVPVIALTLYFGWRYRAGNTKAMYAPTWAHSTAIEWVVWTIPCLIVAALSLVIWRTTHTLDPYQPIKSTVAPVRVDVVALNWKWLFIYPDYGVASVNQLALPVDTPIEFEITADSIMNSFFIPKLGSQVYAMPGMQTELHLIANHAGVYHGLSAAFSGPGFSDMHFEALATNRADFDAWIGRASAAPLTLDEATYRALAEPGTAKPGTTYSHADPALFDCIVEQYMHGPARNHVCDPASAMAPMDAMAMPHPETRPAE